MAAADAKPQSAADAKLDLNTASQIELMKTQQIGKNLAERIQSNAPFSNWEEVGKVTGIGPTRLKYLHRRFRIDIAKQTCAPTDAAAPSGDITQVKNLADAVAEGQRVMIHCNNTFHRAPLIHVSIQGRRNVTNAST